MKPRVAIIGAGWAGVAAAVELAEHAHLTLFDAGRMPGGRARSVSLPRLTLDNGQHILIGAYHECLRLIAKVGEDPETLLLRLPLQWYQADGMQWRCPRLPAPLHIIMGLLFAKGISWYGKWQLAYSLATLKAANWQVSCELTVADWLSKKRHRLEIIALFWRPFVLAAMNTPLEIASMQTLAYVLRDSIGGTRADSELLLPRVDLSALFPLPACRWLATLGGTLRFGHRVRQLEWDKNCWRVDQEKDFDAVIMALAPYHLAALVDDSELLAVMNTFYYFPIYTVYLQFPVKVVLPYPMVGLQKGTAHWIFNREELTGESGLIAAVISASDSSVELNRERLIEEVLADLWRLYPDLPAPLWTRVIVEKRATFASTVGLNRPALRFGVNGLYLAGDWVAADYPATLEGAVRSGVAAARALLLDWARR